MFLLLEENLSVHDGVVHAARLHHHSPASGRQVVAHLRAPIGSDGLAIEDRKVRCLADGDAAAIAEPEEVGGLGADAPDSVLEAEGLLLANPMT